MARQLARYTCERGHAFSSQVPPAAETHHQYAMRQLRMRRTDADLEQILADRLAQLRERGRHPEQRQPEPRPAAVA